MKLLIVIVNYKITQLTIDCLKSLESEIHTVPDAHVALCENGTGPEAVDQLQSAITEHGWSHWVTLTSIYPNRGFTGGNNAVIRPAITSASQTPPEYVLLLNADTLVHRGALKALADFMDGHPKAGIAGSCLENPDGTVQRSAFNFFSLGSQFAAGLRWGFLERVFPHWVIAPPPPAEAAMADWVSGASLIVRKQVLEQIGILDEGLYTYFDDVDLCLRASRVGWQVWYVPSSRIIHLCGQSTGVDQRAAPPKRKPSYWFQARRRFFLKNYGPIKTTLCDTVFILGYTLWRVRRWIQRKPDHDPPCFLRDFIRHSVLITGFRLRPVKNPALASNGG